MPALKVSLSSSSNKNGWREFEPHDILESHASSQLNYTAQSLNVAIPLSLPHPAWRSTH